MILVGFIERTFCISFSDWDYFYAERFQAKYLLESR